MGTEAESVWPLLDPQRSHVVVVENDGEIVGCHVLMEVVHAECLWIHPAHRGKSSVARRLWNRVKEQANAIGVKAINTSACSRDVEQLLEHVGACRLDGAHYSVKV